MDNTIVARLFVSYCHEDDNESNTKVQELFNEIEKKFNLKTAKKIETFIDKDRLYWGDDWNKKIDQNISSVDFFIPMITPKYYKSKACVHEYSLFENRMNKKEDNIKLLPLLWKKVDTQKYQYINSETLFFEKINSTNNIKLIDEIVSELISIISRNQTIVITPSQQRVISALIAQKSFIKEANITIYTLDSKTDIIAALSQSVMQYRNKFLLLDELQKHYTDPILWEKYINNIHDQINSLTVKCEEHILTPKNNDRYLFYAYTEAISCLSMELDWVLEYLNHIFDQPLPNELLSKKRPNKVPPFKKDKDNYLIDLMWNSKKQYVTAPSPYYYNLDNFDPRRPLQASLELAPEDIGKIIGWGVVVKHLPRMISGQGYQFIELIPQNIQDITIGLH